MRDVDSFMLCIIPLCFVFFSFSVIMRFRIDFLKLTNFQKTNDTVFDIYIYIYIRLHLTIFSAPILSFMCYLTKWQSEISLKNMQLYFRKQGCIWNFCIWYSGNFIGKKTTFLSFYIIIGHSFYVTKFNQTACVALIIVGPSLICFRS